MFDKSILGIKNSPVYQELNVYYGQSTVFSALGIERNENRHSAFISWLLNPKSDHQLGVEPLKKFLALYASVNENVNTQLRAALITGRFDIENVQIETEVALSRFSGDESNIRLEKKQKRLDVWAEITISLPDSTSCETIVLVIENKIYSKEGVKDGDYQTEVYHNYLSQYCCDQTLFEVFLTPDAEQAHCPQFVHLTYQELLDNVLQPVSMLATNEHTKIFIGDYIRNLGRVALNDDERKDTYSILATSAYEREKLQQLLNAEGMKETIEGCLYAVYGEKTKKMIGKDKWERLTQMTTPDIVLLAEFWNSNTAILKAMLHTLDIFSGHKKEVDAIFKENNRDNTKYFVEREENGKWIAANNDFRRPLAKGRAACVFFSQWLKMQKEKISLDEAKAAFPVSINHYYENSKWDFVDSLVYRVETRSSIQYVVNAVGMETKLEDDNWDFYPLDRRQCGWGYLKGHEIAIMPKMWRKDDFQLLLDHISENPQTFSGLRIRQA